MVSATDKDVCGVQHGKSGAVQQDLVAHLAAVSNLPLPASMTRAMGEAVSLPQVTAYLASLLRRDPAVFLERYGRLLSAEELAAFEPLRGDYEVDHWLRHCTESTSAPPPAPTSPAAAAGAWAAAVAGGGRGPRRLSTQAKNRRLAHMQGLQQGGQYFSEEAMRARAPLVWYEHIGQYEGEAVPPGAGGASLSDSLLAAHDELQVTQQLQREREAEEAQFSEQEESSGEEEEQQGVGGAEEAGQRGKQGRGAGADAHAHAGAALGPADSAAGANGGAGQQQQQEEQQQEEQQEQQLRRRGQQQDRASRRAHLQSDMESRFLLGLDDAHVDYVDIDGNEALDAHWAAQESRDREEAWFDAE